jgi:hypothetical protein
MQRRWDYEDPSTLVLCLALRCNCHVLVIVDPGYTGFTSLGLRQIISACCLLISGRSI